MSSHHTEASPSLLGAPPTSAVGPAPSGFLWYGLAGPPSGVRWYRPMAAGSDANFSYTRAWGKGNDGRFYLAVGANPLRVNPIRRTSATVYYYVAGPSKRVGGAMAGASGLGQPPSTLGEPYDGAPDRPYPPHGLGWADVPFEDETARVEAASLLGELPPGRYVDRFTSRGVYRLFAFETAHGATSLGALRYQGIARSLGQPPTNPNSVPVIQAAQTLLTYLSQNGCSQGYIQEVYDFQNAYNGTGLGPAITADGDYGPNSQAALQLVLNSVTPPAGQAPDNCYGLPVPATPGPNPSAPSSGGGGGSGTLTVPTVVVAARDYYDTLSATQQSAFRQTLFNRLSSSACPGVDISSITTPDQLTDPSTRAVAVDCFQTANAVGTNAGVLDQATYNAVMGTSGPAAAAASSGTSAASIVVGGAAVATVVAVAIAAATGHNPLHAFRT